MTSHSAPRKVQTRIRPEIRLRRLTPASIVSTSLPPTSLPRPSLRVARVAERRRLSRPRVGGPSLEELRLSGCANLTDDAVEHACAHCPKLLKLAISGCSALRLARLSSDSLRVLDCHAVARAVVHHAADRLACPVLHKIVGEGLDDEEADVFEEVD